MVRKLPHGVRKPEIPCPGNAGLLTPLVTTLVGDVIVRHGGSRRGAGCYVGLAGLR